MSNAMPLSDSRQRGSVPRAGLSAQSSLQRQVGHGGQRPSSYGDLNRPFRPPPATPPLAAVRPPVVTPGWAPAAADTPDSAPRGGRGRGAPRQPALASPVSYPPRAAAPDLAPASAVAY